MHSIAREAARAGNTSILTRALALGVPREDVLLPALDHGSPNHCACLFDGPAGLDINYHIPGYSGTPLVCAAVFARIPLLRFLLSRGADPNIRTCGWGEFQLRPLAGAAAGWQKDEDSAEVMGILLRAGAGCEGRGALQVAARSGKMECVRVLVGWGVNVDEVVERMRGKSALLEAKAEGHEEIVRFLREKGAKE